MTPRLDYGRYTVAWIAPLPIEVEAALGVLDKEHDGQFESLHGDDYDYIGGELNGHNVVVATLPAGQNYGVGAAAALAGQVKIRFPNISFALLVGLAAGLPNLSPTEAEKYRDIRLGDVLVCLPEETSTGIVHYSLGRDIEGGFEINGRQAETPTRVRIAISRVRRKDKRPYKKGHYLANHLRAFLERMSRNGELGFVCPSQDEDQLFRNLIVDTGESELVVRPLRDEDERTRVWYGNLGSGDTLMRNAQRRNKLRDQYNLIGLEMEAAGVMNTLPTGVIRGVCDYGDNYKNKRFQPYAAAVAAVYAKAILSNITPALPEMSKAEIQVNENEFSGVEKELIASLAFSEMRDHRLNISEPHGDTCRWILDVPEYQAWTEQPHGVLWIKGKPGSGKSTVMAYLCSVTCERSYYDTYAYVEFFFNGRGTELQQSFTGMLRSLLNQIVVRTSEARVVIRDYYQEKCSYFGERSHGWQWQEEELKSLLKQALLMTANTMSVFVFVDALDEAGEVIACEISDYFHTLARDAEKIFAFLKICISCRHYPIASTGPGIEIVVEDHNQSDIASFVNHRLSLTSLSLSDRDKLAADLLARAGGIFQWIRLIVLIIEKSIRDGSALEEVQQQLRTIPDDVSNLYKHILLNVVNRKNIRRSLLLFQWTCFAMEPLSVKQLRYAMSLGDLDVHLSCGRCCDSQNFVKSDEIMTSQVKSLSGGLLEVAHGKVQVIHQTVQEYLMTCGLTILMNMQAEFDFDLAARRLDPTDSSPAIFDIELSYGRLYWLCLRYIVMEIPTLRSILTEHGSAGQLDCWIEASDASPLIEHTLDYVLFYAQRAHEHRTPSVVEQARKIEELVQSFDILTELYSPIDFMKGATSLHVAAFSNFYDVATYQIQHGADIDAEDSMGYTALHMAASLNNLEIVKLLLEHGANVNGPDRADETALQAASGYGHLEVVRVLLEAGADVNRRTEMYASALFEACSNDHLDVVQALLNAGADVNLTMISGSSALQKAATRGCLKIVQALLHAGAKAEISGDEVHGSALHLASFHGHVKVVIALLKAGAKVDLVSKNYGNALQAASVNGHIEVVQALVKAGANVNLPKGHSGSALGVASEAGHVEVVQTLLQAGADVNLPGGRYGNALQAASASGNVRVVEMLLKAGAAINSIGGEHGCALQAASVSGNVRVVQVLLEGGADVNLTGDYYGCAIRSAWMYGQVETAQLLLDHGARLPGADEGSRSDIRRYMTSANVLMWVEDEAQNTGYESDSTSSSKKIDS